MRTKHMCVLIHIKVKGEIGTVGTIKMFKPSRDYFTDRSKAMLLLWIFFLHLCFTFVFIILSCLFLAALESPHCWERADFLGFFCMVFPCAFVTFPYRVSGVVIDFIDSWALPSLLLT